MKILNQYSNEAEAYIDAGMLESNGIDVVVQNNALSDIFPAPGAGTGSILLLVPDSQLLRARELLRKNGD